MKLTANIEIKVPESAEEWELYTNSMRCGKAARSLTAALKKSMRLFIKDTSISQYDALKPFFAAANKWADYGTSDSEPVHHAERAMRRLAETLGRGGHEVW